MDQFQIQDNKRIEDWNQTERDECGNRESADLRVAEWFPKRTSMRS
jgi:hypothetical protein